MGKSRFISIMLVWFFTESKMIHELFEKFDFT